jgi:hypothetical protein
MSDEKLILKEFDALMKDALDGAPMSTKAMEFRAKLEELSETTKTELSVYSCWTAKLLLRAPFQSIRISDEGTYITIDVDDKTLEPKAASEDKEALPQ